MDEQNRNLLLAMVLCTAVLFVWFALFPPPEPAPVEETSVTTETGGVALPAATSSGEAAATPETTPEASATTEAARISIETPSLFGSAGRSSAEES